MTWIASLLARLRGLWRRPRLDAELDAELAYHLEMKERALERQGVPPRQARLASRHALGNATLWKEDTRELWRFAYLESLWSDLAYAVRMLRKDRLFTLAALVTLTLGIGANTAVFSLLNGLLWRPLPVGQPEQVVHLTVTHLPPTVRQWVNGRSVAPTELRQMTYFMYNALVKRQQVFAGMFAMGGGGSMELDSKGTPYRVQTSIASGAFFPVLQLRAQAGRLLTPDDDRVGGPPGGWNAVISDNLWTKLFERSPRAIGAGISIERVPFTVVGVAPASFHGINPGVDAEAWVPLMSLEAIYPNLRWRTDRGVYMTEAYARLQPGVSIAQARQSLTQLAPAVMEESEAPSQRAQDKKFFEAMQFAVRPAAAGTSGLAVSFAPALWILLAVVAAVLLIAATNLTSLFLARSTARGYEIAVRLSLGAPLALIRRQFLLESLLLAGAGAAAGLAGAKWLTAALEAAVSSGESVVRIDTSPDLRLFAFLALILVAVVVLAGLAPALSAARTAPHLVMRRFRGGSRGLGLRRGLIVLQTALSLTLLGGAGLMLTSLRALDSEPTGFHIASSVFLAPDLFNAGISRERIPQAYQSLLERVRQQPNIVSAAWTMNPPLSGGFYTMTVQIPGRGDLTRDERNLFVHRVSEGYFSTVGIPLLAGTDLPPAAAGRRDLGLLSEQAARRFFGSPQSALGQRVRLIGNDFVEIIGVVGDAKYENIREPAPATLYLPYWHDRIAPGMNLAVRYQGPMEAVVPEVEVLFQQEAGRLPYTQVRTLRGNIADSLGSERLLAWLLGAFAGFGLLISATGLAGLFFYLVEQRRKELGIRLALGSTPGRLRRQIEGQGLALTAVGLVCGGLLSYVLRRALNGYLFGISAADPRIWAVGVVTLVAAALAATAIPAWRASRVDPVAMLRED